MRRKRVCCLRLYNFSSCNNFSGTYQKTREPTSYRRLSVFIELPLLGNRHVRRLLVEATQHYRRRPAMTQTLRQHSASQPEWLQKIGWEAQKRLHKRLMALKARGKPGNKAITAVARELAGFVGVVRIPPRPLDGIW